MSRLNGKGQVTIPAELRQRLRIEKGSLLEVEEHEDGVMLKPLAPLRGGDVAGEESYREILRRLESLRKKWRDEWG